ncbi:PREDICTED: uncharacterized protein At1g76660-like isoform X2 [Tarenaya hassleriana]|uniref:uncharacterized protein At1g76660-like isoform X2 n=1 Tax=Tarenaya hassleriana TaxID=28532 RepID=UPI00053C0CFF|nr:PREDICTED: uncharacterized protein At1g76660-like isoform X2 [Tarenaya hassleriana]
MATTEQISLLPLRERRKKWVGCFRALSCFGARKGERRIVPAARIPDGNSATTQSNGPQASGLSNQATSILAPPSSPASFSHSAVPSTVQSPNNMLSLSANSLGGPVSTMFATGPYAHESQLVSPPVFSTFTTEPSTAPLTPPPELAHLTTPSSPDVPYARFLTSASELKNAEKTNYVSVNDLQATYSLYPGCPASNLRSPISKTGGCLSSSFPDREFPSQWDPLASPRTGKCSRSDSSNAQTPDTSGTPKASEGPNFFCPATFARYYLDHDDLFSHTGGRLSVSKDSDGNEQQHRLARNFSKQDMEELEAYRASFGFSADEIITKSQYVEITDVNDDDSFTIRPLTSEAPTTLRASETASQCEEPKSYGLETTLARGESGGPDPEDISHDTQEPFGSFKDQTPWSDHGSSTPGNENGIFTELGSSRKSRKYRVGVCSSDAEIDYRRGRRMSLREGKGDFAWHD